MRLFESLDMTAAFPGMRAAEVSLVLRDSRRLSSGRTTAPGDPGEELSDQELADKFLHSVTDQVGNARAQRMLALLVRAEQVPLPDLLDEMVAPVRSTR